VNLGELISKFQTPKPAQASFLWFWATTSRDISDVAELFRAEFNLSEPLLDYENVWMWFEASSPDSTEFNVSRPHTNGRECYDRPLHIALRPPPADTHSIGQRMAHILGVPVHFGLVEYIGGDDYRQTPHKTYEPVA
jgi:hypothetical protein